MFSFRKTYFRKYLIRYVVVLIIMYYIKFYDDSELAMIHNFKYTLKSIPFIQQVFICTSSVFVLHCVRQLS